MNTQANNKKGFTLVEVMVSVSIFAIIMTVGLSALVTVMGTYRVSQSQKTLVDNTTYIMEHIVRELRVGDTYYSNPARDGSTIGFNQDGNASSIGFNAADNRGYFFYYLDGTELWRKQIDGSFQQSNRISGGEVEISQLVFNVVNSTPHPTNTLQPSVLIFLETEDPKTGRKLGLRTLVSQRKLDY